MRGMRGRRFRGYRRPVFRPIRPWMRFGWGWWGMGCLFYPVLGALAIFALVLLLRMIS